MSQDWKITRISDICKTNPNTYSVSEKWSYVNYLDTGSITENSVSEIQHLVIGRDTLPSRARRKVVVDDILYSTVRPNQRHYGIVKDVVPNMLVSTGFAVIRVDKAKADADYLYYYLTQNDIVDGLHAIGEQSVSAYPSIKPSDIESIELLLPSLPEQVEIGRTLKALDDKIANNTKINHHLEERSETDSSPDIRRGKRVSRNSARRADSSLLACIFKNIGVTFSSKFASVSSLGKTISKEFKTVVVMLGTAEPTFIPAKSMARMIKYANLATFG